MGQPGKLFALQNEGLQQPITSYIVQPGGMILV